MNFIHPPYVFVSRVGEPQSTLSFSLSLPSFRNVIRDLDDPVAPRETLVNPRDRDHIESFLRVPDVRG